MGEKIRRETNEPKREPSERVTIDPETISKVKAHRRRALNFVESMLESGLTIDNLKSGEGIICQADYDDLTQERWVLNLCGYVPCSNEITRVWKQKYHVSLRTKQVFDVEVRKLYCSNECMRRSLKYRNENLPERPVWMKLYDDLKVGSNSGTRTSNP